MLTQDTNIERRDGKIVVLQVAAATNIFAGAIVCINEDGYAVAGTTATGLKAIGRAEDGVKNEGADGELSVTVSKGIFRYSNSTGADEIKSANIGDTCYIVDDNTVALTDGTATRSAAGIVFDVQDDGVWIQF